jgi:sn-glycerol 3-phosphate transport system permease protein
MRSRLESGRKARRSALASYALVAPAVAGCLLFTIYPLLFNFFLSGLKWDLLSGSRRFVGIANFSRLLGNQAFLAVLANTALYMAAVVAASISLALLLAVALKENTRLNAFAQSAIFTPHIVSLVSVSILWMWIMEPEYGLLNFILGALGLPSSRWLESPDSALLSLMIVGVWKTVGYNTLVLLAGIQSIPPSVYEAARLDKAGRGSTFFRITLPLLSPSLFFIVIVNVAAGFQVFDSVHVMTQGGPMNSTNLLVHWIYQTGFEYYRIGEAAAGSIFLFLIVALATALNFRLVAGRIHYQ